MSAFTGVNESDVDGDNSNHGGDGTATSDDKNADYFLESLHRSYILAKAQDETSMESVVMAHLRMSGVYWSVTGARLMGYDVLDGIGGDQKGKEKVLAWISSCYVPEKGGYGGNVGHDPHLLYTLSALQIYAMEGIVLDDAHKEAILQFVASLQQNDGSFTGDEWGEVDTRFVYCAFQCVALLLSSQEGEGGGGALYCRPSIGRSAEGGSDVMQAAATKYIDVDRAVQYILSCQNFDGGFGAVPGAESHAGQIFCCVGALSLAGALHKLEENDTADLLAWWLSERQCDSGGLNGRPEKQADVCYSWWILSSLKLLGKASWIDQPALASFILRCQDSEGGGIADHPDDVPDIFHTYFGIAGLALLDFFQGDPDKSSRYDNIDPAYALPCRTVAKWNLQSEVLY